MRKLSLALHLQRKRQFYMQFDTKREGAKPYAQLESVTHRFIHNFGGHLSLATNVVVAGEINWPSALILEQVEA